MPRTSKPSGKSRHNPLLVQIGEDELEAKYGRTPQPGRRKKSQKSSDIDEDGEAVLDSKTSKRILELARDQQKELESDDSDLDDEPEEDSVLTRIIDDDVDEDDVLGEDENLEDVEEVFEIDEDDMETLDQLLPHNSGERKTLADIIFAKISEHEAAKNAAVIQKVQQNKDAPDPALGLDPKVVEAYTKLGEFLRKYKSGPLPKLFKVIPTLPAWARILALTQPENWSPHAARAATRIFVSTMKPPQAQLFLSVVLLDAIREDIRENKKLNVQYYEALKRALYKPGAFFKGIIFPMLEQGCTLKEAAIVASVLARAKVPVLHASAALLRIAEMDYSGPNSLFIRVLIDKKFALPYKVVDALVFHFIRLSNTYKARNRGDADKLPVLWHQSLLVFAQRYASDLTPDQKDALLDVVRVTPHAQIGPEIRRELVNSVVRGEPRPGADEDQVSRRRDDSPGARTVSIGSLYMKRRRLLTVIDSSLASENMYLASPLATFVSLVFISAVVGVSIPTSAPSSAVAIDKSLLAVSIEFFAFPGYTNVTSTSKCLDNLGNLRGSPVAVRIGGTTQDRATYDPSLQQAVSYTVASPADAPTSLTFGSSFFSLATKMKGDVTIGLNRQLNNQANSFAAAQKAKELMPNLFAIELGNEPDLYSASSPIAGGTWNANADAASEKSWFTALAPSIGNIFQGAVYLDRWTISGLIPQLGNAINTVKSFSGHSYPQSACGGASTNLQSLMSHAGIVSYTRKYSSEASAVHNAGKRYFLGETNSGRTVSLHWNVHVLNQCGAIATCGGGGISPTFGAALWIVDYVLQGALNGVERLYFHQGTIGNCQYCWWGRFTTGAPFYGTYFVNTFLGTDGARLSMLDDGAGAVASYVVYNSSSKPLRVLVYNSNYYSGSGTRSSTSVSFTGGGLASSGSKTATRLTAPNATSRVDQGAAVTIGGGLTFDGNCNAVGSISKETVSFSGSTLTVSVKASEALIIDL
uniref:Beta-glucuronidase C-terminal domain-containing protein n=1 Tax=Moniliophthora roreri TaxID=221103 RepID=A0A0W0G4A6_MONRR